MTFDEVDTIESDDADLDRALFGAKEFLLDADFEPEPFLDLTTAATPLSVPRNCPVTESRMRSTV